LLADAAQARQADRGPARGPGKYRNARILSRVRLLAIDLDGTLVDSAPDLAHCVGSALGSLGFVAPGTSLTRAWIGDGIETLLRRALAHSGAGADDATLRAAIERFTSCYRENLYVRSRLYPDVEETLATLGKRGIKLACVTNKRIAFADALLAAAGIRAHFGAVFGGDSLPEKKPSPAPLIAAARDLGIAPANCAMVGDSHHDYHAAADAGFVFFWARYGYCAHIEPRPDAAIKEIGAFGDLRELVH
jgi:phosphoglycolate phosphatase